MNFLLLLLWKNLAIHMHRKFLILTEIFFPVLLLFIVMIARFNTDSLLSAIDQSKPAQDQVGIHLKDRSMADIKTIIEGRNSKAPLKFTQLYYAPYNPYLTRWIQRIGSQRLTGKAKVSKQDFLASYKNPKQMRYYIAHVDREKWKSAKKLKQNRYSGILGVDINENANNSYYHIHISMDKDYMDLRNLYPIYPTNYDVLEIGRTFKTYFIVQCALNTALLDLPPSLDLNERILFTLITTKKMNFEKTGLFSKHYFWVMDQIIVLSLMPMVLALVWDMVNEKECGVRHNLVLFGFSNKKQKFSWLILHYAFLLLFNIGCAVILVFNFNGTSILGKLNPMILIIFINLIILCSVCFAILLSTWFNQKFLAVAITSVIYYTSSWFGWILHTYKLPFVMQMIFCFLPNVGLSYGMQVILLYDLSGLELSWKYFFKPVCYDQTMSIGVIFAILIWDCILYLGVAFYITAIRPGRWAKSRSWLFCINCKEPELPNIPFSESTRRASDHLFEKEPVDLKVRFTCEELCQVYGLGEQEKVVLNNVSFSVLAGQITVLFGHHGCGKSTIISLLSGFTQPSSGKIIVNGENIVSDRMAAIENFCICPYHDILFENLTVGENVLFYALSKFDVRNHAILSSQRAMRLTGLASHATIKVSHCSFYLKKKVCMAIALTGTSSTLILDDPCEGWDLESRKHLWDCLDVLKHERYTIVVSSDSMEESTAIGDRIIVIAQGQIHSIGSPGFLKRRLGAGLKLVVDSDADLEKVHRLVQHHIPTADLKSFSRMEDDDVVEFVFILPFGSTSYTTILSRELETQNCGVQEIWVGNFDGDRDRHVHKDLLKEALELQNHRSHHWLSQIFAVILKLLETTRRRSATAFLGIFMPLFYCFMAFILFNDNVGLNYYSRDADINLYDSTNIVIYGDGVASKVDQDKFTKFIKKDMKMEYVKIVYLSSIYKWFQVKTQVLTKQDYIRQYLFALELPNESAIKDALNASHPAGNLFFVHIQPFALFSGSIAVDIISNWINLVGGSHHRVIHSAATPMSRREVMYGKVYTDYQTTKQMMLEAVFPFIVQFGMAFLTVHSAVSVLREIEIGAYSCQIINGLHAVCFWSAHAIVDTLYALLVVFLIVAIIVIGLQNWFPFAYAYFPQVFILLFLYSLSSIVTMYWLGLTFKAGAVHYGVLLVGYILLGFIPIAISFGVRSLIKRESYYGYYVIHILLCSVSGPYCLGQGITKLFTNWYLEEHICAQASRVLCEKDPFEHYSKSVFVFHPEIPGIFIEIVVLLGQVVIAGILLSIKILKPRHNTRSMATFPNEDEDILGEHDKVDGLEEQQTEYPIVFRRVIKSFRWVNAVKEFSAAIRKGEKYALLGSHEAGKTTILSMMLGETSLSSGDIFVGGYNLRYEQNNIHTVVGYCPQNDQISQVMTVQETLNFYAHIAGLTKIHEVVHIFLQIFYLLPFADLKINQISVGLRRKVSLICAILGNHPILVLDDPTRGLDPLSRRQTWEILRELSKNGTTIIFTSHSVEEVQSLCDRLCILVQGTMACLGSPHSLRNKYGNGFSVSFKFTTTRSRAYMEELFPTGVFQGRHMDSFFMFIPGADTTFSQLSNKLEELHQRHILLEYEFRETTLIDIYHSLIREDDNENLLPWTPDVDEV